MDPNLIGTKMNRETLPKLLPQADKAVIIVDGSGSRAGGDAVTEVQSDAVALTRGLEAQGTKVGVLSFSDRVEVQRVPEAGSAESAVRETFRDLQGYSGTGAATALKAAGSLAGPNGLVIMLTDGMVDPATRKTVEDLQAKGVRVIGVGQGKDDPRDLGSVFNEHYRLENQPIGSKSVQGAGLVGREFHPSKLACLPPFQAKKAVLLLDTSGSRVYNPGQVNSLRRDAHELTEAMQRQNGSQIGVMQFSDQVARHPGQTGSAIDDAFNHPIGASSDGLLALQKGARELGGPGTLIFMTDGELGNPKEFKAEVARLKSEGIQVVAVGMSSDSPQILGQNFDLHYRTVSREPGFFISK